MLLVEFLFQLQYIRVPKFLSEYETKTLSIIASGETRWNLKKEEFIPYLHPSSRFLFEPWFESSSIRGSNRVGFPSRSLHSNKEIRAKFTSVVVARISDDG